jgi:hypothetical protein
MRAVLLNIPLGDIPSLPENLSVIVNKTLEGKSAEWLWLCVDSGAFDRLISSEWLNALKSAELCVDAELFAETS